ncbi:MAG: hypothetical protein GY696_37835, partial [Gammaproteobacteria bacterium]|nr:hypothetical protein [Gammaproteobacteria bacterium]
MLGPHLFTAYVDSILELPLSENSRIISFSDDLILIKPIRDELDSVALQNDIDLLINRYGEKFMKINPEKSKFIIFTLENKSDTIQLHSEPKINGLQIYLVPLLKYLGVYLDPKFIFGPHFEHQVVKAKQAIGALYRTLGKWASKDIFKEIYTKKILPLYMYAIPAVAPSTVHHSRLLEKVNRFAGRLIENDYNSPYEGLIHKLGWKPMSCHIFERQLILSWKYARRQGFLPEGVLSAWEIPSRLRKGWGRHDQMISINDGIFCGNCPGRIDRKT